MAIMPNGIGTVAWRSLLKLFSHQEVSIAQNADVGPGGFVESRLPFLALCRGLSLDSCACNAGAPPVAIRAEIQNATRYVAVRHGSSGLVLLSSFGSVKLGCCVCVRG